MNNQQLATMAILHGMDLPRLCSASCAMTVWLCGVVMTSLYLVAAISSWHRLPSSSPSLYLQPASVVPGRGSAISLGIITWRMSWRGHSGDQPRQAAAHTHQLSHLSSCAPHTDNAHTQNMLAECRAAQSRLVCAQHWSWWIPSLPGRCIHIICRHSPSFCSKQPSHTAQAGDPSCQGAAACGWC